MSPQNRAFIWATIERELPKMVAEELAEEGIERLAMKAGTKLAGVVSVGLDAGSFIRKVDKAADRLDVIRDTEKRLDASTDAIQAANRIENYTDAVKAADRIEDYADAVKDSRKADNLSDGLKTAEKIEGSGTSKVHGNDKLSTKPQHGYEIYNTETGDIVKTGISGQNLNLNGTSPRANSQVNKLNNSAGKQLYDSRIIVTNMPNRSSALEWERENALRLWSEKNSMILHKRPRPWEE